MNRILAALLLALPALAVDSDLQRVLKSVETRYNGAQTLHVGFEETFAAPGRGQKTENGELYLRKPGKMRWDYKDPAGKLFISDGKNVYFYSPATNKAEKMNFKDTEDMRAPLAFLLGKLDFDKEFQDFQIRNDESGNRVISAKPKSDRLPYRQVEFAVNSHNEIKRLHVWNIDGTTVRFGFSNERMNPKVDEKQFRFELPAGATYVEPAAQEGTR